MRSDTSCESANSLEDASLLRAFENQSLPFENWTHQAHVRVAFLYLSGFGLEDAIERMRLGIKAYNAVHGVQDGPHTGYHETTTQAFMRLIHHTLQGSGIFKDSFHFCKQNVNLMDRRVLMCHYTRDQIMKPDAKHLFIEPDIASLDQIGLAFPEFGRQDGITYTLRPGGYGVIADNSQRIAIVRTPTGSFLPGGGQEDGESAIDALHREAMEECGLIIRVHSPIGTADEFVFLQKEHQHFCKRCTFYSAEVTGNGAPCETDHELVWLAPDEAAKHLTDGSQRWAVLEWQMRNSAKCR